MCFVMTLDPQTFITRYRAAFGEAAPLPLVFFYSDAQTAGTEKIPGCFLRYLHQAMDGKPVCLGTENITCGGGKFYAGFTPMPDHVPIFVSQKEKYKETPELIKEYLGTMGPVPANKKYLNFVRADQAGSFEGMEGLLLEQDESHVLYSQRQSPQLKSGVWRLGLKSILPKPPRRRPSSFVLSGVKLDSTS